MFIDDCMELTQPLFNIDCKLNLCDINKNTEAGIYDFFCMDADGRLNDEASMRSMQRPFEHKVLLQRLWNSVKMKLMPLPGQALRCQLVKKGNIFVLSPTYWQKLD